MSVFEISTVLYILENKVGEFAELGAVSVKMVTEGEASFMKGCKQKIGEGKLKTFNVHKKTTEVEVKH